MKILIFSSYFLPHKGGVETYVYQTARRLAKRHKVWVVTSSLPGTKSEETMDGIHVVRLPAVEVLRSGMNIQLPFFSHLLKRIGKVNAIITHTRFYPLSFTAGLLAYRRGIPWLHIEHGAKQVEYDNPVVRLGSRLVDATTGSWILRHATVAGVSKASCNFAKVFGARSCVVLYNGTDTKFFGGKRKKHKGIKIVYIGRLIKEKGVQDLLHASKRTNAEVIVIGSGPYESELKKLGGNFAGEKSHKQIRDILAGSDFLVNPSYGEGLPSAVLEAGAMGLAVVATDVGGTSEIIEDGKNGFLVSPGNVKMLHDRIVKLAKNVSLREKFGKALQKTVRAKFDWDEITLKLEKVLKSL